MLQEGLQLTERMHHLGNDDTPEWPEATEKPEGKALHLSFEIAKGTASLDTEPATLALRQRHVSNSWAVLINGQHAFELERNTALEEIYYVIPAGLLKEGANAFELKPEEPDDDITIGEIRLWTRSLRDVLQLRTVRVTVKDARSQEALPARVTFVRPAVIGEGSLPRIFAKENEALAIRRGVVYTSGGELEVDLPQGDYEVFAARGMEWSVASSKLSLTSDSQVHLELTREVNTEGFIACDTHIHTLTHSGHGDSTVEERMVTLAGEGVELAVATDHNHNTNYRPTQERMGLNRYFTPTTGNEITTPIGHFNAFPLDPEAAVPLHDSRDIEAIVKDARDKGAQAVILNHPRWPDHERGPYGTCGLDHHTGEARSNPMSHPYDAIELINSQTEEKDPMLLFRDWFALRNAGIDVTGVASSDSHTVGGVVGQGRTYLRSSSDDPARIDVSEAAANLVQGRSSLSMGIFVDVQHAGRSVMGELLSVGELTSTPLKARIAAPSWVRPRTLTTFVNGHAVQEISLITHPDEPYDETIELSYRGHSQDAWVCIIVTGDAVDGPYWPQLNPYTLGASNPISIDADGDQLCSSPKAMAQELLAKAGTAPEAVARLLPQIDSATAIHVLHQTRQAFLLEAHGRALEVGTQAAGHHPEIESYLDSLREPH